MITINLFTSGKNTQPVIETLRASKNLKLLNVYSKLPPIAKITRADLFLVADFGAIVPSEIFQQPKYNTLCLHPSLLPKYRGASPVPYAIMNGDKITGITIFELDAKIDHGKIISQLKEPIKPDDTQETLLHRLFQKGGRQLVKILPDYIKGRIKSQPQNHSQATYARRLRREDGQIDWRKTDAEIERFIRAMHPWPGAHTNFKFKNKNLKIKILKAHLSRPDRPLKPIGDRESLVIDEIQLEGKKPITWQQFQAGYPEARFD